MSHHKFILLIYVLIISGCSKNNPKCIIRIPDNIFELTIDFMDEIYKEQNCSLYVSKNYNYFKTIADSTLFIKLNILTNNKIEKNENLSYTFLFTERISNNQVLLIDSCFSFWTYKYKDDNLYLRYFKRIGSTFKEVNQLQSYVSGISSNHGIELARIEKILVNYSIVNFKSTFNFGLFKKPSDLKNKNTFFKNCKIYEINN